jgi:hypothetical protein
MANPYSAEVNSLVLGGADNVRASSSHTSIDVLEDALELATEKGLPACSKTLILTLQREIRRKRKAARQAALRLQEGMEL